MKQRKKATTPRSTRTGRKKNPPLEERAPAAALPQERSRILFDTMSQGVVFRDADGKVVSANPAAERIFGRPLAELLGKTSAEIHHDAVREDGSRIGPDEFPAEIALQTAKTVENFVMGILTPAGPDRRWLNVQAVPFSRPGELRSSLVYILFEDITERLRMMQELQRSRESLEQEVQQRTQELVESNEALSAEMAERKRAEQKLAESAEMFRRLAESADDLIYIYRLLPERKFDYVSPAATRITGYTPDEHYADPELGLRIVHPEDRGKFRQYLRNEESFHEPLVVRWVRKDGRIIWTEQRTIPVTDTGGRVVAVQGMARDITERVRMEERLQASEKFLQTIIDSEPECVKLLARDGTLLSMNPAGLAMIDAESLDQVRGKSVYGLILPPYRADFTSLTESVFAGKTGTLAFEAAGLKGRRIWLETHAVPLRDEQGDIMAALGITRDITFQRSMETRLRESEAGLKEAQRVAHMGSWDRYLRTQEVHWSPETFRILGYDPASDAATFEKFRDAIHTQDRDHVLRAIEDAVRRLNPYDVEFRFLRTDGSLRYGHARAEVVLDEAGVPFKIIGTLQDLTERRRAEDLLPRIAQRIAEKTGEEYFRSVCAFICQELGTDVTLVGEFLDHGRRIRTVSVHADGAAAPNETFTVADTPAEHLAGGSTCFFPERSLELFPRDPMLARLGIQCCAGTPLLTSEGRPLGVLITLGRHPIKPDDRDRIVMLLRIFSGRAAAELERGVAEEALTQSEQRYRQLLESVTSYLYTVTVDGGKATATEHGNACVAVTGYTSAEYAADPFLWYRMIHDRDKALVLDQAKSVLAGGHPKPVEHRLRHKNGTIVWVRNTVVPRFDDRGSMVAYDGIIEDITARKRAEEFAKNILESVDEGFIVIDRNYTILSANKAYCTQAGVTAEEIVGKKCYAATHRISKPCYEHGEECAVRKAFETGEPHVLIHTHHDTAGVPIFVETKAFPLHDDSGSVFAAIEIINNISERKRLEEQLRHAQKMEAVGLLAGGIAHDFNNILTAIVGYGNLLKMKTPPDTPHLAYVEQILASAARAANLTQSLLAFSRKQVINPRPMDVNDAIRRIEKLLARVIGEDIDLRTDLVPGELSILADSSQIEQVLMNLATNARDAMPRGGTLKIHTSSAVIDDEFQKLHGFGASGRYARIVVTDSGAGMDAKTQERIFEPFFTTKEQGKGTGLGLAIVYGIMKQNSGYITVTSEPGKGSEFSLFFPVIATLPEAMHPAEHSSYQEGHETILVAEDDVALRELTKTMLSEFGYTVIEAVDGEDAIAKFRDHRDAVQLAILDVVMPRTGGREARDAMLQLKPDLKVLFISGYTSDVIRTKGVADASANFILKPVSPMDLLKAVRRILDEGARADAPVPPAT